jgi:hypothetical protein
MCNGANLAYTSTFRELNGFNDNDEIASGDDVFLLQKSDGPLPDNVHCVKSKKTTLSQQKTFRNGNLISPTRNERLPKRLLIKAVSKISGVKVHGNLF